MPSSPPPKNDGVVSNQGAPIRQRCRTSVACAACRARRSRCVIQQGQTACDHCRANGSKCIIQDDKRRKPVVKAHMELLAERMKNLEDLLINQGIQPKNLSNGDASTQGDDQPQVQGKSQESFSSHNDAPEELDIDTDPTKSDKASEELTAPENLRPPPNGSVSPTASPESSTSSQNILNHIVSTQGHWSYDETSGRLRYFGPTTNFHIYSGVGHWPHIVDSREQERHGVSVLKDVPPATQEYLMDLYWTYYNSILYVVHKEAFYDDQREGRNGHHSALLHLSLLAMGMRFADSSRDDIKSLMFGSGRETRLHREAKRLLEYELETPGGVPSVQALLILGDLECAVGRDNTGWMYVGMACRLAIDVGLNLDCTMIGLPPRTVKVRHMVMWACIVYDRYWALFLGRPTMIKPSDLVMDQLSRSLSLIAGESETLEGQIYCSLLELMSLAGKMTEIQEVGASRLDVKGYLAMAGLDRELNEWYSRLPQNLQWRPINIQSAPASFFLLHQQFYSILILLHRPFAQFRGAETDQNLLSEESPQYPGVNQLSIISQKVCFDNAIRVARIFKYHYARFPASQIFITGLDHAGTAATALIAGIANIAEPKERIPPMRYLYCIADAMKGMSSAYRAAERMANVLDNIFKDPSWAHTAKPSLFSSTSTDHEPRRCDDEISAPVRPSLKRSRKSGQGESAPETVKPQIPPNSARSTLGTVVDPGYHPNKRYFRRSPSANPGPGFGLDAILASTWANNSFPSTTMDWMNEMSGDLNPTDPLLFDDNLNFITMSSIQPADQTNVAPDLSRMGFIDDTVSSPSALLTSQVNNHHQNLGKINTGPSHGVLAGGISPRWTPPSQHMAQPPLADHSSGAGGQNAGTNALRNIWDVYGKFS